MTPKEKAEELFKEYFEIIKGHKHHYVHETAKICALVAVNELLSLCWNGNEIAMNHWKEVKKEIELL